MEKKKRNLDWVGKKRDFKYSGKPFYIGFIPKDRLEKISDEEYSIHSSYRRNYFEYYKGFEDIEKLKKQIKKIQEKQKVWKSKMVNGYNQIGYLSKDFEFYVSIDKRKRKSITRDKNDKGIELSRNLHNTSDVWSDKGDRNNPSESWETFKGKIGKGKLKEENKGSIYHMFYVRVETKSNIDSENRWRRNLYVGKIEDVIYLLDTFEKSVDENKKSIDWDNKSEKFIKNYLREVYRGYVRYHIYHDGVDSIKRGDKDIETTQHNLDKVVDWVKKLGVETLDWMDE
jgi:hypothetical protein